MPNTLTAPAAQTVLTRLFDAASHDHENEPDVGPDTWSTASAGELAELLESVYMPVSEAGAQLLYSLVRAVRPSTIIEFGTSFAISTIHLAAGVTDNGCGRVYTTELSSSKAATARTNLDTSGVGDAVEILLGDARDTLADVAGPVDFVFLDGWKDLCLPVLRLLEPRLTPGALVVADDAEGNPTMADYLAYVRDPQHCYVSTLFPVEDGMEISCWTGPTP